MAVSGKVVHYDTNRGFGFLAPESGGADVFLHINDIDIDEDSLKQNAKMLEGVLQEFGVRGQIDQIRPGPVVTMYELVPAPGVKTARVDAYAFAFGAGIAGLGDGLTRRAGLEGSFFTGILATVVATPCTAPFMAAALGAEGRQTLAHQRARGRRRLT